MIVFALIGTTTGCGTGWFGNESAPSSTPTDKCTWILNEKENVAVPPNPLANIEVIVKALRYSSENNCVGEWSIPVSIHIYATAQGSPAIKMSNGLPLPWTGERLTTWSALFAVQHGDEKIPHPRITIDLIVKHLIDHPGNEPITDRIALGCLIRVNGGTIATDVKEQMRAGQTVRCQADFNL